MKFLRPFLVHTGILLSVVFLIPSFAFADSSWLQVGSAGFSPGGVFDLHIALPPASTTPYVVFENAANGNKASVMKYNGTSWVDVGTPDFSPSSIGGAQIAFDSSGVPYVAFSNAGDGGALIVKKFDGTDWISVGAEDFSDGEVDIVTFAFSPTDDVPYVAYKDLANGNAVSVMKFDGTTWVEVGTAGFSAGAVFDISLAFDSSDVPYVAYQDVANSSKATVMKFNGTNWVEVGTAGFSSGIASDFSLAFAAGSTTPYVAFRDAANSGKATVMKFEGSGWVSVGGAGFSQSVAENTRLLFDAAGSPYVLSRDESGDFGSDGTGVVMKYNGSSWSNVGGSSITSGSIALLSFAIDSNSMLYAAYRNSSDNKASVVKFQIPTYTITFDTQGGSSVSTVTGKLEGASFALPSAPTFSGKTFQHWNTAADDSGTSYSAGAAYTTPSTDSVLYAIWQEDREEDPVVQEQSISAGTMPWCSGPMSPGWNVSLPGGGCGGAVNAAPTIEMPAMSVDQYSPTSASLLEAPTGLSVRDLQYGDSGDDVKTLQDILIAQGYSISAGATAYFGSQTRSALVTYQSDHGITPAAGYFGSITRAQMKAVKVAGLWW